MAQSIIRRAFMTKARVPTLSIPRDICGGRINTCTILINIYSVSPPISITQMLLLQKGQTDEACGSFKLLFINWTTLDRNERPWICCPLYVSIWLPDGVSKQDDVTLLFQNMFRLSFFILYSDQQTHTIISQIITLLHISTLSCHPQTACNQYLSKLHQYFKCSCR